VTVISPAARVLVISDDPKASEIYCRVLEFVGYQVTRATDPVEALGTPMSETDVIVVCGPATVPFPEQAAGVVRIPEGTPPDVLVADVYRRVAPRPAALST
jgi:CheY-like chemotaxis protein